MYSAWWRQWSRRKSSAAIGATSSSNKRSALDRSAIAASPGSAGPPGAYPIHETYYTLEFTNVSNRTCSLFGYPEVSAYRDSPAAGRRIGGPIGGTAIRDTSVRPKPVILEPGATAHAVLRVASDTKPAGCAEVTAGELRITLPRQARPSLVPAHIPVCTQRGHASLSVQAIQARPGIPGHSVTP